MWVNPNTIQIASEIVPYRVEKTHGKKMGLKFRDHEPVLVIRTPEGKLTPQARTFVESNHKWILKQYKKRQQYFGQREQFLNQIRQGHVMYMGRLHELEFRIANNRRIHRQDNRLIISYPAKDGSGQGRALLYAGLRALAKDYLTRRTRDLAAHTDSDVNTIRIKDHKSKWGSCSGKRNINLNWHLIFLDPALIDYVIIHELMHLREMNHSPRFWKWVETFYPQYKTAEKNLRNHQWLIGILAA